MKTTYVIDANNNITLLDPHETKIDGEIFSSESDLLMLTEKWPDGRLLEVRNSMPGVEPAAKINNGKKVVAMIWRTVNQLMKPAEADAELKPKGRPKAAHKGGEQRAPVAKKGASKSTLTEGKRGKSRRRTSKKEMVLAMIRRKGGATLDEIVDKTGWQKHTVRGFMATVPGRMGLKLTSEKVDHQRTYSAA